MAQNTEIIFTHHSLIKLEQRGISQNAVKETLTSPDYKSLSYGGRLVASKKFDNVYLKVVYKKEEGNIIVITQYWTKKVKI